MCLAALLLVFIWKLLFALVCPAIFFVKPGAIELQLQQLESLVRLVEACARAEL